MKVVARPVDMLVWFGLDGQPHPVRFRFEDNIIQINKVITHAAEKTAGNNTLVFTCQSIINQQDRVFELRYELRTCKWTLFKI